MTCKGILFDFDGVVVKSMEQHFDAWQKSFIEQGVHITSDEFFVLEGMGIQTISQIIGDKHGLSTEQVELVRARKVNYYNQYMTIEFYDDFKDLLADLHQQQIPMGIVTGGTRERVQKIVDNYFADEFSCVVTVDDVGRGKPFPDPFLKGAEKLGLKPDECVVIENAPLGIEGAKEAGMRVVAITTTLDGQFLKQADFIVPDFRKLKNVLADLLHH